MPTVHIDQHVGSRTVQIDVAVRRTNDRFSGPCSGIRRNIVVGPADIKWFVDDKFLHIFTRLADKRIASIGRIDRSLNGEVGEVGCDVHHRAFTFTWSRWLEADRRIRISTRCEEWDGHGLCTGFVHDPPVQVVVIGDLGRIIGAEPVAAHIRCTRCATGVCKPGRHIIHHAITDARAGTVRERVRLEAVVRYLHRCYVPVVLEFQRVEIITATCAVGCFRSGEVGYDVAGNNGIFSVPFQGDACRDMSRNTIDLVVVDIRSKHFSGGEVRSASSRIDLYTIGDLTCGPWG